MRGKARAASCSSEASLPRVSKSSCGARSFGALRSSSGGRDNGEIRRIPRRAPLPWTTPPPSSSPRGTTPWSPHRPAVALLLRLGWREEEGEALGRALIRPPSEQRGAGLRAPPHDASRVR
ncbi:hypothetical protein SEVIR_9G255633v4 [Setaria viridis]|uniref:Uncharacterized protein n=1 Tax=Setaria viridis TaxID=4556 RepID=A0A4U6SXY3_SETVI|nr:hypothetical protein SEVIR_9G255633v2 [Setaria viridis]